MSRRGDPTQVRERRGGHGASAGHHSRSHAESPPYEDPYEDQDPRPADLVPEMRELTISEEAEEQEYDAPYPQGYTTNAAHEQYYYPGNVDPPRSTWPPSNHIAGTQYQDETEYYQDGQTAWTDDPRRHKSSKGKHSSSRKNTGHSETRPGETWPTQTHPDEASDFDRGRKPSRKGKDKEVYYEDNPSGYQSTPRDETSGFDRGGKKTSRKGKDKEVYYPDSPSGYHSTPRDEAFSEDPYYQQPSGYSSHGQEDDHNFIQETTYQSGTTYYADDGQTQQYYPSQEATTSEHSTSNRHWGNKEGKGLADIEEETEDYGNSYESQQPVAEKYEEGPEEGPAEGYGQVEQHHNQQQQQQQGAQVGAEELLKDSDIDAFYSFKRPYRTVYLYSYTQHWTEANSIFDSANSCFHLLSLKMVFTLEYPPEKIDLSMMASFRTLGGRAKTMGSLTVWFRFTSKAKEEARSIEFQVFDDTSDDFVDFKYDVVFKGNLEDTKSKSANMMVRPKHLNPEQDEMDQMWKNIKAQQEAALAGKSRRKAREKAMREQGGSNHASSSKSSGHRKDR